MDTSAYWSQRSQRFLLTATPVSDLWDILWKSTKMNRLLRFIFSGVRSVPCEPICAASFPSAWGIVHLSRQVTWKWNNTSRWKSRTPRASRGIEEKYAVVYLIMRLRWSREQSVWQMYNSIMKLRRTFNQEDQQPPHTRIINAKFEIESVYSTFLLPQWVFFLSLSIVTPKSFNQPAFLWGHPQTNHYK